MNVCICICKYEVVIWNLLFSGGGHIPGSTACSVLFWVDIALRNSNSIYICMYARMYVCMYLIGSGRSVGSLVWFRPALFILPQVQCMYAGGKTALVFVGIRCGITVIHTYIHTYIHVATKHYLLTSLQTPMRLSACSKNISFKEIT